MLNNTSRTIETPKEVLSVEELLAVLKYSYKMLIVKVNDVYVSKEEYPTATVKEGDNVQVIHLISGG
jgi:thiamine biosynthesis protein ThiS